MFKKLICFVFFLFTILLLVYKINFTQFFLKTNHPVGQIYLNNEQSVAKGGEELEIANKEEIFAEKKLDQDQDNSQQTENTVVIEKENLSDKDIQEELDNIAEKLDVISWQIAELLEENQQSKAKNEPGKTKEDETQNKEIAGAQDVFCDIQAGSFTTARQVIINEIAWMGNNESANNEWIELKNLSRDVVSLSGWQLVSGDGKIKILFGEKDLIKTFYLLERTNDDNILSVAANKIYNGALDNGSEKLYLFDYSCVVQDAFVAQEWLAGDNFSKRTMERKFDFGWQTSAYLGGTPGFQNSIGYEEHFSSANPPAPPVPVICSYSSSSPDYFPIVFNEIAWMGFGGSSEEWIEMKNTSTSTISLVGWQIIGENTKTGKNNIEIYLDSGVLPPENPFYLLERTDDDSAPEISADKIFTGPINDSDFILRLFDSNCRLIDEIKAGPDWPAGEKDTEKRTMERGANLVWYDSFATTSIVGIFGTPKSENSLEPKLPAVLELFGDNFAFKGEMGDSIVSQTITLLNSGESELFWVVAPDSVGWLYVNGANFASGSIPAFGSSTIELSVDANMSQGVYSATMTAQQIGVEDNKKDISVSLTIFPKTVKTLVINEIAWMGTAISPYDEWIEIFNNTEQEINLNGWSLRTADGSIDIFFSSTSVPAKSYFLLERTDDTALPEVSADFIYTGSLGDSGERVELIDGNGILIDVADCASGWFAGDKINKSTMERKIPQFSGSDASSWGSSSFVGGTPKFQNGISQ